jgi:hypothetical protein
MKQTAVDKLLEYFIKEQKEGCSHWCIHDLIAQLYVAKEMEKEQIIESASVCCASIELSKDKKSFIYLSGEAFYKAKYIEKVI